MKSSRTNIEKSFQIAIIILLLLIIVLLTTILNNKNSNISTLFVGLPILIASVLGVIGSIYAIKGLKEKKTIKMGIAILINFGVVILIFALIIANVIDIIKAFI